MKLWYSLICKLSTKRLTMKTKNNALSLESFTSGVCAVFRAQLSLGNWNCRNRCRQRTAAPTGHHTLQALALGDDPDPSLKDANTVIVKGTISPFYLKKINSPTVTIFFSLETSKGSRESTWESPVTRDTNSVPVVFCENTHRCELHHMTPHQAKSPEEY